jgi:hypothetical protein
VLREIFILTGDEIVNVREISYNSELRGLFFSLVLVKKTNERRSDETERRKQVISSDFRLGKVSLNSCLESGDWMLL